jgi:hypothetical protein
MESDEIKREWGRKLSKRGENIFNLPRGEISIKINQINYSKPYLTNLFNENFPTTKKSKKKISKSS